jgi:hypothetical protein
VSAAGQVVDLDKEEKDEEEEAAAKGGKGVTLREVMAEVCARAAAETSRASGAKGGTGQGDAAKGGKGESGKGKKGCKGKKGYKGKGKGGKGMEEGAWPWGGLKGGRGKGGCLPSEAVAAKAAGAGKGNAGKLPKEGCTRVSEEGSKAGSAFTRIGGVKEGCTRVQAEGSKAGSAYTRGGEGSAGARLLAKAAEGAGAKALWEGAVGGMKRRRTDAKADVPAWLLCPAPQPITSMLLSVCFRKTCLWITSELLVCSSCALSILYAILGCVVRVCI